MYFERGCEGSDRKMKKDLGLQAFMSENREDQRADSELLVGTLPGNRIEVIIKYHGDLREKLKAFAETTLEECIAGYGILCTEITLLNAILALDNIEYVEKAKGIRLTQPEMATFKQITGKTGSQEQNIAFETTCVYDARATEELYGRGILLAVIDSGCQYELQEFRKQDGTTKLVGFWNQKLKTNDYSPPDGFLVGSYFTQDTLNRFLTGEEEAPVEVWDSSGHGTLVSSVAVGNSCGVAPLSDLLVVALGGNSFFEKTTDLMRAVTFAVRMAEERNQPLVINLSLGFPYGSHRGDSLLERFLNNASEIGRSIICVGSGNEGESNGHFKGQLKEGRRSVVEFTIGEYESSLLIECFFGYSELARMIIRTPSGRVAEIAEEESVTVTTNEGVIFLFRAQITPYSGQREYLVQLTGTQGAYLTPGIWRMELDAASVRASSFEMYMPTDGVKKKDTGFLRPDPYGSITIPATAGFVLSVGASDLYGERMEAFSGRGFLLNPGQTWQNKPDIAAPGNGVLAVASDGRKTLVTGTSFATPIASGIAALLMEWGIVRENDRSLYGHNCIRRLCMNATVPFGSLPVPNPQVGWGVICAKKQT